MTRHLPRRLFEFFLLLVVSAWSSEIYASDPGVPDPNTPVTRYEYDYGDTAFTPTGGDPVEVRASVYAPSDLSGGPYPLILFIHGVNKICHNLEIDYSTWPCPPANPPVPNYTGYDYIGEILASHGYIVVSISANGVIRRESFNNGPLRRAELIQEHLDRWAVFNTTVEPQFNGLFVGKVDLDRVGTMGHSRGGDGVVQHFVLNQSQGSPYGVRAVMPLAPSAATTALVDDAALAVGLPYCDGDVWRLEGVSLFDRARYDPLTQQGPRHTLLFMGANHSYFNTVWGGDGLYSAVYDGNPYCDATIPGNGRLTPEEQRAALVAYLSAFFRFYLGGEREFGPLLTGDAPVPPSALPVDVHVGYHPSGGQRLDVNPLEEVGDLTTNALGGAVTQSGLATGTYELCGESDSCLEVAAFGREPHQSYGSHVGMLRLFWDGPASFTNELAPSGAPRNVSGYRTLQFRASVSFEDPRNPLDQPQDFRVVLADGSGREASVWVGDHSDALFFPPGLPPDPPPIFAAPVPRLLLNTARIPLSAFAQDVDLTAVESIRFDFEGSGAVFVSDLALADANAAPIANAGPDQQVGCWGRGGTLVQLHGGDSTDLDGDAITFSWEGPFPETPVPAEPVGPAPYVLLPGGENEITLTVTDSFGASDSDTVIVTVTGDADGDRICDVDDNCPSVANFDQWDHDGDGVGTACDWECADGFDNDGDGRIDWPEDLGCQSPEENMIEAPECDDHIDNDGDGYVDFLSDPECAGFWWWSESQSLTCGLLGIEVLPVLGWALYRRRRRQGRSR